MSVVVKEYSKDEITVNVPCESCAGTGIVCGVLEPKGIGVVCFRCYGTGAFKLIYTPFTKRATRRGVKFVQISPVYLSGGSRSSKISYASFLKGKVPKMIKSRAKPAGMQRKRKRSR